MAGAPQQQSEPDNSLAALWITIGLFVLFGFIWYFLHAYIVAVILVIRHYEANLISFFIPSSWSETLNLSNEFINTAKKAGYANVTFEQLIDVSNIIGNYLRYPAAVILGGLAILIYVSDPTQKYRKTHNMQSLLDNEKESWPQVMPVVKLDLVTTDLDQGPWAMSLQPMAFAKKNQLLIIEKRTLSILEKKNPPIAKINRDEARKIFALQMGRFWISPEALPIHARALFAVFAARVNGDRNGAVKLLEQLSRSTIAGNVNFTGVNELLRKHKDNKHIMRVTKKHAYELTVMATMLEFARQDGVLATADFLWLKPIDRKLWFMLSCVGRQTAFCEVSGPFAHWVAEKEFGRRLNVPMVEEAVTGLEKAVQETIFRLDEEDV